MPPRKYDATLQRTPGRSSLAGRDLLLEPLLDRLLARHRIRDLVEPGAHRRGHVGERLGDEHPLGRPGGALLGAGPGQEPVLDQVVLGGRVQLQRGLDAVVVGDDEAVGRHERRRAAVELGDRPERRGQRVGQQPRIELHPEPGERRGVPGQGHLLRHPHPARIRVARARGELRIDRRGARARGVGLGRPGRPARRLDLRDLAATAGDDEQEAGEHDVELHALGITWARRVARRGR